jgi:NAD(P)H dehydrogenase (quinone)
MSMNQSISRKTRILILGSTGRTGQALIGELQQRSASVQIVYSSRKPPQVDAWRQEGKEAVLLDLNNAKTLLVHGTKACRMDCGG